MSANAIIRRLEKLEAVAPAPPSPFDGMTIDEMSVLLLEQYAEISECEEQRDRIIGQITATVNLASGRWALAPCFKNYQEHIASEKAYWERLQSTRGEYVPSLNHEIETDGFPQPGRGEPAAPDLMGRRAKLWQHPMVAPPVGAGLSCLSHATLIDLSQTRSG
jgi:hypothetical protein